MIKLTRAKTDEDFFEARILFEEYGRSLPLPDLEFQNFSKELLDLKSLYTPPKGRLLLARRGVELVGCVAVRRIDKHTCEMKRLYVRAPVRGTGVGKRLALEIIAEAKSLGYGRMRLDTLPSMEEARTLYQSLGFKFIQPYYNSPIENMVFMEIDL